MVTLLTFADGEPFATGAMAYFYSPATYWETTSRILLRLRVADVPVTAIVDTGAPFVVCPPHMARRLDFRSSEALGRERLLVRGAWYEGRLYRLNITFDADEGTSLTVDATAFVPEADADDEWSQWPVFVGLGGCLERMRFAIDPGTDTFYFGPL